MSDSARADKWLWATRFYKTRSLAAKTCAEGKVRRAGLAIKAATSLHPGDVLEVPFPEGPGFRTIRVVELIELRIAAPLAQVCYEDLTPPEVYEAWKLTMKERREAGSRPTKRERRQIGKIRGFWD